MRFASQPPRRLPRQATASAASGRLGSFDILARSTAAGTGREGGKLSSGVVVLLEALVFVLLFPAARTACDLSAGGGEPCSLILCLLQCTFLEIHHCELHTSIGT